jgi:hypothetical protein
MVALKPHQEYPTREDAALALEAQGYVRTGGRWGREVWTKEGRDDWLLMVWPTGVVTLEWPEQGE